MGVNEIEIVQRWINPPLVAKPEMAKVIQARMGAGSVLEMKVDNRYKDGNIKVVDNVVRGNKKTISLDYLEPPRHEL